MILHNNNNNTYIYSAIIYYYYYYIMCLYEASTVLSIFNELTHLIVLTALWGRNSNFIDNNTGPDRLNNLIELIQVGSSEANTGTSQPGPRAQALNCHSLLPSACFPWKAEWRPGWAVRIFQCSKDPSCELTPPPTSSLWLVFPFSLALWGKLLVSAETTTHKDRSLTSQCMNTKYGKILSAYIWSRNNHKGTDVATY